MHRGHLPHICVSVQGALRRQEEQAPARKQHVEYAQKVSDRVIIRRRVTDSRVDRLHSNKKHRTDALTRTREIIVAITLTSIYPLSFTHRTFACPHR